MKLVERPLVSPNGSHPKIDPIGAAVKLNVLSQPIVLMKAGSGDRTPGPIGLMTEDAAVYGDRRFDRH